MEYTHGKIFERQDIRFIYLQDSKELDLSYIKNPDVAIVDCTDDLLARRKVHNIRGGDNSDIYLTVLVLHDPTNVTGEITRASVDEIIKNLDDLGGTIQNIQKILNRINQTKNLDDSIEITS